LTPRRPPPPGPRLEEDARAIVESGAAPCGFTTSWPSWVMLENFSAWHNIPLGTQSNGFDGFDTELVFNNEHVARHWDNLKAWQDENLFRWGGPGRAPMRSRPSTPGECGSSSAPRRAAPACCELDFEVGFGFQPYYDDIEGAPQNTIIGGATLWVMAGHDPRGIRASRLLRVPLAARGAGAVAPGHRLPADHPGRVRPDDRAGVLRREPGRRHSIRQMTLNPPTENSRGLRFGNFVQIRDVISEEMEAVMTGAKSGQQAADDAVSRGNALLREFEAAMN
jgi:sn-glycerol 3-phosphate transport system substrate-binding protein